MERLRNLQGQGLPPPPNGIVSGMPPSGGFAGVAPLGGGLRRGKRKRSFSQLTWDGYFTEREIVKVGDNEYCVYKAGEGPAVLCLHGAGHSALSWAMFTTELLKRCHVQVIAIDQRGHGDTHTTDDSDLSADTLTQDVVDVWNTLNSVEEGPTPPLILLGHSMGGAVAVRISGNNLIPNLRGLVVIDVVEGTALESLSAMQGILQRRPPQFKSVTNAIEWAVKSGQIRNTESARVSVRGQLKEIPLASDSSLPTESSDSRTVISTLLEQDEDVVVNEVPASNDVTADGVTAPDTTSKDAIVHDTTNSHDSTTLNNTNSKDVTTSDPDMICTNKAYTWRVDLVSSEKYWKGWFSGMSNLFLSGNPPKLLLLAGPDRLDTELTVAHMQGKFQLQMFNHCGHSVQEDVPESVADVVTAFFLRQRLAQPTTAGLATRAVPGC